MWHNYGKSSNAARAGGNFMDQNEKMELEMLRRSNVLWGKTLVACGDSFTEGDFTSWKDENGKSGRESPVIYDSERKTYKTYPWWIAERNNMKLKNLAKCGGTIALTRDYLESPDTVDKNFRCPFANEHYLEIGDDPDYILIMYGLNDMYKCELGCIDDTTPETFYGAFNFIYRYLIEKYPRAKIGSLVCNAYLAPDFRDAVRETAIKWGIPYLDLFEDTGISTTLSKKGLCDEAREIRNRQFFVSKTNGHPNLLAHELMSSYVEEFLRRI